MSKCLTWIFFTLVIAVSVSAHAEEWRKTYAITGKPDIRVDANDAEIRVYTADRKDVEAVVFTQGYKIGSGGVNISERQAGDRVELNVHTPSIHFFSFGLHKSVRVELNIPREADLDLHSGDGNITAENLKGKVTLGSGDGNIQVNDGKGTFDIETGDGRVECRSIEGTLKAETKDGAVRIDGVFAGLDLHTGDGNIDADARAGSKMASSWSVRTGGWQREFGITGGLLGRCRCAHWGWAHYGRFSGHGTGWLTSAKCYSRQNQWRRPTARDQDRRWEYHIEAKLKASLLFPNCELRITNY